MYGGYNNVYQGATWDYRALVINIVAAVFILGMLAVFAERSAHKNWPLRRSRVAGVIGYGVILIISAAFVALNVRSRTGGWPLPASYIWENGYDPNPIQNLIVKNIVSDTVLAVCLLSWFWLIVESLIRRREGRKP